MAATTTTTSTSTTTSLTATPAAGVDIDGHSKALHVDDHGDSEATAASSHDAKTFMIAMTMAKLMTVMVMVSVAVSDGVHNDDGDAR